MQKYVLRLLDAALILALAVIVLGAYVRLSGAGLGCPDWPGCYGHLVLPQDQSRLADAAAAFPARPLAAHKAWKEMGHRYAAGVLVLAILALSALTVRMRARLAPAMPIALLALIVFQALLGMWTVTMQLKPVIVMGHLLGGFATLALLWWWRMESLNRHSADAVKGSADKTGNPETIPPSLRLLSFAALAVLILQIALGGWTSANYAALACPDFPTCQGAWWPQTDFSEAFVLWRGLGVDYEFGVLDNPARAAIHLAHRLGALLTALVLATLGVQLIRLGSKSDGERPVTLAGLALLLLLGLQLALGISNVVFHLPIGTAVAHNGVAALLLLAVLTAVYRLWTPRALEKPTILESDHVYAQSPRHA